MNGFLDRLDIHAQGLWLPLVFGAIVLLFVIFMPKRQITWLGIYFTFGVIGYVGLILDINVMAEYFDLFDLGDPLREGIGDLASYAVIPSCLAAIFLNYYDKKNKWLYVAVFTFISYSYEWALTSIGYMKLAGWQNWYSIPVFIVIYGLWLPWHLEALKKVFAENVYEKQRYLPYMDVKPALKPLEVTGDDAEKDE